MLLTYAQVKDVGDRFLDLLHRLDIDPPRTSNFEAQLLSIQDLLDVWADPSLVTGSDYARIQRAAAGVHDLAAKVLAAEGLPDFPDLVPHLQLIARKNDLTGSITQNERGAYNDDSGRKLAELYLACLAVHCGSNLALDHPTASKGDNPDVMFDYKGRRWALAVKTISSRSGQTIFERIAEGVEQIDRSVADIGLVVLNARDAVDHAALLQSASPFTSLDDANQALQADVRGLIDALLDERPSTEFTSLFGSSKAGSQLLVMAQAFVQLSIAGVQKPIPTALKTFQLLSTDAQSEADAIELATALNHWAQTILEGRPARLPSTPPG